MIIGKVKALIAKTTENVVLAEVVPFNQKQTIDRINLYVNQNYMERDDDSVFWDLSTPRIVHFSKNLDFDSKDLLPYGELDYMKSFVIREKTRAVYKNIKLYKTINTLCKDLATYGSGVLKVIGKGEKADISRVEIRNLYLDPATENLRDSELLEYHYMTRDDLKKKKKVWDKKILSEILSAEKNSDKEAFDVYEFWGYIVDDEGEANYKHAFVLAEGDNGMKVVFEEDTSIKKLPYYDYRIGEYRGRWLGIGVPERLFQLQHRINKLVNYNDQASEIATLLLFRTANGELQGNVLEKALNGDIINSEDLQQIGITQTAFNNFVAELKIIEDKADQLCFTPEVISGETMPSGTPFRGQALTANMALSSFTQERQNIGEDFGEMVYDEIIAPMVAKWNRSDYLLAVTEPADIEVYNQALLNKVLRSKLLEGVVITPELVEGIRKDIETKPDKFERQVRVEKGYIDYDFGIRLNVTGESVNKAQKNDAYANALTWVLTNPGVINIPLFRQYLENNDIPWWKLTQSQLESLRENAQGVPAQAEGSDLNNQMNLM